MTHRLQLPRGTSVKTDTIRFLAGKILQDAMSGTESSGIIEFGDRHYRVVIKKIRYRQKFWQLWRPKR